MKYSIPSLNLAEYEAGSEIIEPGIVSHIDAILQDPTGHSLYSF
jgi:hypothetical protein